MGLLVTPSTTNPAGANKQVQINNSGVFGAEAGFEYDLATNTLTAGVFSGSGASLTNLPAAGSDTQVQFNDGGTAVGGDSGLTYDKTTDKLTVAGQFLAPDGSQGVPGFGFSGDVDTGFYRPGADQLSIVVNNVVQAVIYGSGFGNQTQWAGLFNATNGISFGKGLAGHVNTVTDNTALDTTYYTVWVNSASNKTITLPTAVSQDAGRVYRIKNINTGVVTIARSSSDTIDGATSYTLPLQYQSVDLIGDGTASWYVH